MICRLSINLNKVALLRNQRDMPYPSVRGAARQVAAAGARGITVHPRPDQRHIRRRDVRDLARLCREELGPAAEYNVEYNIEGYPSPDWLDLVLETRPDQATLVPDAPEAHTSDQGWDIPGSAEILRPVVARLQSAGIRVALFVDCDPAAVQAAKAVGADRVELYTGPYGAAHGTAGEAAAFAATVAAGKAAAEAGLGLNAGHDLNLENLPALSRALPNLAEVSIGHAFTADALERGYRGAVTAYLRALEVEVQEAAQ